MSGKRVAIKKNGVSPGKGQHRLMCDIQKSFPRRNFSMAFTLSLVTLVVNFVVDKDVILALIRLFY